MASLPSLIFCFPYRGVGGVPLLFLRVGEELATTGSAKIFFVDYSDGFLARSRRSELCTLIEYTDEADVVLPGNATLVLQSITPWSLYPSLRIPAKCKILYWNCHPFNLVPTLPGLRQKMQAHPKLGRLILSTLLRRYRSTMRALVQLLTERHALVFMDSANLRTTEQYLKMPIPAPVFLPVAAGRANRIRASDPPDFATQGLRIGWVGRIVDMKYYVLRHALEQVNNIAPSLPFRITFTVVGSGDHLAQIRSDVARLSRVDLRFVDHIPPDRLDDFLITNVDLLFAMGTAALEGARLGIPTILLDVAYGPVPSGYQFKWLYEREGYTLGDLIGPENIVAGNQSLAIKLQELETNFAVVSARTKKYFEENHSLSSVAERLVAISHLVACTYGEMTKAGFTRKGLVYRVFSGLRKRFFGHESSHTSRRARHPT